MARRHHGRNSEREVNENPEDMSLAQRYQAFRQRRQQSATVAARFADTLDFALDDFQRQAIEALEHDDNVLVAAPTGAGKTIIADFAVYLAQERNVKAFYTTPIKALSNQKYHDLVALYGADKVGLLTGDTSINSEADIVVMTTEVLRNMLYEHSSTLTALRYVILDEVHYLADRFRGPVWEEVIIHLPQQVRVVGLSATVSNVEDFSVWIESTRGRTTLVVSERRPVPLEQHVMVQSDERHEPEIYDLYRSQQSTQINTTLVSRIHELDRQSNKRAKVFGTRGGSKHHAGGRYGREERGQRYHPKRWAVVDELHYLDMLPGIYFIFSRNGCDMAVQQCLRAGLELTTAEESQRIRAIVDEMVDGRLTKDELKTLHFAQFRFALEEGFAPHHAGMIALFRQIVERLFEESLVKVVFATETLALGINMPARCVVVEKLDKFDGTGHVPLTPGEFTQLTGRAGRRGIDTIGHAVVVDHRDFQPQALAALSSKRVYPLHSSFKPTFNMAVNLLNGSDYQTSRATLDHSFAQWEANESAEALESRISTLKQAIQGYEQAFACDQGDFKEFITIRLQLTDLERNERRALKHRNFHSDQERKQAFRELDERIGELRAQDRNHPCRQCADIAQHMRWGHRWMREIRELNRARERYESRTGSVARQFDTICMILERLGYLRPEYAGSVAGDSENEQRRPDDYTLTQRGQLLRRIYSEQDLVLAHCLSEGLFDDLKPTQMAALASAFVYESRRGNPGEPRRYPGGPNGRLAALAQEIRYVWHEINVFAEDMGLNPLQELDFGMVDMAYDWASGKPLSEVLENTDMTAGDFVRTCKRLTDILGQMAQVGPYLPVDGEDTAANADHAASLVNRGLVAYSGVE